MLYILISTGVEGRPVEEPVIRRTVGLVHSIKFLLGYANHEILNDHGDSIFLYVHSNLMHTAIWNEVSDLSQVTSRLFTR